MSYKKIIVLALLVIIVEVCTKEDFEYMAAVVEHYPTQETNLLPAERLKKNTEECIGILKKINMDLDIIVFPEATLYSNAEMIVHSDAVPYAAEIQSEVTGVSLCQSQKEDSFLSQLACAAQKYSTYLVANVVEKSACDDSQNCAKDGWDLYNTNIVFDRNGAFVSKYRKFNLFGEFYMNRTTEPDIAIFKTDFGITFGMFTCFDLVFRKPTVDLVKEHGVKHLIFPTMWFSELPFLTALQAQHQWAYELDVVLLASGANHPQRGSGGTGIYQGRYGPLSYGTVAEGGSQAFVAKVSNAIPESFNKDNTFDIDKTAKKMDTFFLLQDGLLEYTSKLLSPNKDQQIEQLCSETDGINRLCCNFNVEINWDKETLNDDKNHYHYRMVAYSGVRSFTGMYNGGMEICGIVACTNKNIDSCGKRFEKYSEISWPATFKRLNIKANYTIDENRIQHPSSLLSSIMPLPVSDVEWIQKVFLKDNVMEINYRLKAIQKRLLTFGIFGRDFNRDGPPETENSFGFNSVNVDIA